jgi:hypothetical protein
VATDEAQAKLFATLSFVEEALPEALKPLLVPLALHERFGLDHGVGHFGEMTSQKGLQSGNSLAIFSHDIHV